MTSIELLHQIEAWLSFNTEPSCGETYKLRETIKQHIAEQKLNKHSISGKRPEQDLRDFFLWAVRVAKIEVIDAENAIELKGYWKEDAPLGPVLNLDELIQEYQAACASGAVDKTVSDGLCDFIEGQKCDCKIGDYCKGRQ